MPEMSAMPDPEKSAIAPNQSSPNPSVFLVIPAHNRREITLSCLNQLQQNGDLTQYQAIVVDDGSSDGTGGAIAQQFPDVIVLAGDGNLWWTGAIAKGMASAADQGADYFFWLNDDCLPEAGAIAKMVQFMQAQPNSLVSAACYLSELEDFKDSTTSATNPEQGDRNVPANHNLIPTGAQGRKQVTALPGEVVQVSEMSGHCVGIPAAVVAKIGFPDGDRCPQYFGDNTYILKAVKSGFSAYILGDAQAKHLGLVKSTIADFVNSFRAQGKLTAQPDFWPAMKLLFGDRKSIFYLPAQFNYCQDKYGAIVGLAIFGFKLIGWLWQLVQVELRGLSISSQLEREQVLNAREIEKPGNVTSE
ncbi:glycosyl transferase family 2 [Thalassoporum mexicanum PCC 7367]|uniref:glycosyltransferase family 2 protein n=1 Tax=Thalassoporum mexicanum TaxID=3457544 RepID=UPI00029F85F0|nr:glycosyltransferase family 2 protein [Pseudanabaena sp. PCC 7367]AFY71052.1 glycosyl transferase family 2 [Pseudanabaena sp. PCC 7367]